MQNPNANQLGKFLYIFKKSRDNNCVYAEKTNY